MRKCSKCHQLKKDSEFTWNIPGVKRHSACKPCRAIAQSDYYERTKPERLKYKWERQVLKKEFARKFVWEYLSYRVCEDCGEYDPLILTFDHVRGEKKMNVSQMVNQGYSIEAIQEEINKCAVVCFNCHMRREKNRRGTKYWQEDGEVANE